MYNENEHPLVNHDGLGSASNWDVGMEQEKDINNQAKQLYAFVDEKDVQLLWNNHDCQSTWKSFWTPYGADHVHKTYKRWTCCECLGADHRQEFECKETDRPIY